MKDRQVGVVRGWEPPEGVTAEVESGATVLRLEGFDERVPVNFTAHATGPAILGVLRRAADRLLQRAARRGIGGGPMTVANRRRAKRTPWTLDQWADFARRCQAVRDRIDGLIRGIPDTRGLKTGHINPLVKAHERFVAAMIGLEGVFLGQHPGRDWGFIHGAEGASNWGVCRGRVNRSAPVLSREAWVGIGAELKAVDRGVVAVMNEVGSTAGATKAVDARFRLVRASFGTAKCRLDSLVCAQHRDWPDATRVFYGQETPAL